NLALSGNGRVAFVLRQIPPDLGLPDRNQRGPGGPRAAQRFLARGQLAVLASGDVPLVAGDPAKHPDGISCRARGAGALDDLKAASRGQRTARDRIEPLNAPPACAAARKRDVQRWHRTTVLPSPRAVICVG